MDGNNASTAANQNAGRNDAARPASASIARRIENLATNAEKNARNGWGKIELSVPKYVRFISFVVFVFFVLKSIRKISLFFNINSNTTYTYFAWFSILMFLFVVLPVKK